MVDRSNNNEHWKRTIESLDLHSMLLGGMAVFIAYFSIRDGRLPLPKFFVIDPFMSAVAFAVVVSRTHVIASTEPFMARWWDRTIDVAPRFYRSLDFALEGPYLFLILAMPFSCISPVVFGACFSMWSILEAFYLGIGKRALRYESQPSYSMAVTHALHRYYLVRMEHEILAAVVCGFLVISLLSSWSLRYWFGWLTLLILLLLVTLVEAMRNPWYWEPLLMDTPEE